MKKQDNGQGQATSTFTMEVRSDLIPKIAAAGRTYIVARWGQDTSGYTDIQVMRYLTKQHWIEVVSEGLANIAAEQARQDAKDDMELGLEL